MSCVSPAEWDDWALVAYVDGEADPELLVHLGRCSHCLEKAHRLARLQDHLIAQLYRVTCPSSTQLGEYHLGLMPSDQATAAAAHLAKCPHCAREVAQLESYMAELEPSSESSLLEWVGERVKVLIARPVGCSPGNGRFGQPALGPAYAGLRGKAQGSRRYKVGGVQIVVDTQDDPERQDCIVLLGLLLGIDVQGLEARLWKSSQLVAMEPVDSLGNFVFSGIAPGCYELILGGLETEIHIPDLELQTGRGEIGQGDSL